MPPQNELSHQNIQDRYHGHNDPVARKILATNAENRGLRPPDDITIVSMIRTFRLELHVDQQLDISFLVFVITEIHGTEC